MLEIFVLIFFLAQYCIVDQNADCGSSLAAQTVPWRIRYRSLALVRWALVIGVNEGRGTRGGAVSSPCLVTLHH
jgi:hypothetical protein